jgi:hypothetical protein
MDTAEETLAKELQAGSIRSAGMSGPGGVGVAWSGQIGDLVYVHAGRIISHSTFFESTTISPAGPGWRRIRTVLPGKGRRFKPGHCASYNQSLRSSPIPIEDAGNLSAQGLDFRDVLHKVVQAQSAWGPQKFENRPLGPTIFFQQLGAL